MNMRELSLPLRMKPTLLNVTALACAGGWAVLMLVVLVQLGRSGDPRAIELMAVGSPMQRQPVAMKASAAPQPQATAPVVEAAEPMAFATPEGPTFEILEVIEYPAVPEQTEAAPEAEAEATPQSHDGMMFDGRPLRKVRTIRMLVTAYSPDARSCGKWADGITASGYSVWTNGMALVAADTSVLPFHSIVTVPGYNGGRPVPVLDRGGAIKGHRLDLLMPTHEIALQWGAQRLNVDVWEYAD